MPNHKAPLQVQLCFAALKLRQERQKPAHQVPGPELRLQVLYHPALKLHLLGLPMLWQLLLPYRQHTNPLLVPQMHSVAGLLTGINTAQTHQGQLQLKQL